MTDSSSSLFPSLEVEGCNWKFQPRNQSHGRLPWQPGPILTVKSKSYLTNITKDTFIASYHLQKCQGWRPELYFLTTNHNTALDYFLDYIYQWWLPPTSTRQLLATVTLPHCSSCLPLQVALCLCFLDFLQTFSACLDLFYLCGPFSLANPSAKKASSTLSPLQT